MMPLDLSQMFDGAPRLLSADELRQKFQQAGLGPAAPNFSTLELVICHVRWQGRKRQTSPNLQYMRSGATTLIIETILVTLKSNFFREITYVHNVYKVCQTIRAVHFMFIQEFLLITPLLSVADPA